MYDQGVREKEGRRGIAPPTWDGSAETLLRGLEKEARASFDREAYRELLQTRTSRLGLTAVLGAAGKARFLVVVLVDRSPQAASMEAALTRRGYSSMRLDEGWIAFERAVAPRKLGAELRILRGILIPEGSL